MFFKVPYSFQKENIDIFKLEHFKQLKVSTELLVTANDMFVKVLPRGNIVTEKPKRETMEPRRFLKA